MMRKMSLLFTVLALCLMAGPRFAFAADPVVIKAGLIDPPGHIDTIGAEKYAALVAEKTDGRVKIEVYPASQLGFAMDMLQGMQLGTIEMFIGATTWLGAFDPDFWISGCLYVFNDQEHARRVQNGPFFKKMADKLAKNSGIRIISQNWDRGPRNIISTMPVKTPEDMKGLKIRVPEQKSWIANFKLAGANPTPIALAETFTGLQQGIVDATEQASNWLYFNKYHTIAKHLTRSNHNYEETGIMISEKTYEKLSEEDQKALFDAAQEVATWHNEQLNKDIADAEKAMADAGVEIIEVDHEAWQTHFRNNFKTLVEQVGYSPDLVEYIMSEWKN